VTDQLLNILKVALLALLYLFFARVVWAVWSEVRTPVATAANRVGRESARSPSSLTKGQRGAASFIVIEPKELRGLRFPLSNSLTIGRSGDADISIANDSYASQQHARIEVRADGVWIVDLGSTNGTYVNGNKVSTDKSLRKGDRVQTGSTVLEMN
jgi:pSer/pThr/pTyr-binding forkhead associated (FHA) protein